MEIHSLEEFDRAFFARYGPPPQAAKPAARKPGFMRVVHTLISIAVIALLAVGIFAFIVPLAFKVKPFNVENISMQPFYNVGTLVWVAPASMESIKAGDDVTYQVGAGLRFTNRVVSVDKQNKTLTVQGTRSGERLEQIGFEQVHGVVRFHVHGVGRLVVALRGEHGPLIALAILLGILLLWLGTYILGKRKESGGH